MRRWSSQRTPGPTIADDKAVGAPPVLGGGSRAGQARWHLPKTSVQTGLAADAARVGDLEVRAASVIGPGHRCDAPAWPRQDAYALGRSADDRFLVVSVADGVSSSSHSDLGARVAATAATRKLAVLLDEGEPDDVDAALLFRYVAGEMVGTGRARGVADDDLCSVLVVAVIPTGPGTDGRRTVWTAQVGDASVWLCRGGRLRQVTGPVKAGMDRNVVREVLPFHGDCVTTSWVVVAAGDAVAVMTDGVSETLTDVVGGRELFEHAWSGVPPHPAAFLHDLCYDAPGQADDRTAVVVWCRPDRGPLAQGRPEGRG